MACLKIVETLLMKIKIYYIFVIFVLVINIGLSEQICYWRFENFKSKSNGSTFLGLARFFSGIHILANIRDTHNRDGRSFRYHSKMCLQIQYEQVSLWLFLVNVNSNNTSQLSNIHNNRLNFVCMNDKNLNTNNLRLLKRRTEYWNRHLFFDDFDLSYNVAI